MKLYHCSFSQIHTDDQEKVIFTVSSLEALNWTPQKKKGNFSKVLSPSCIDSFSKSLSTYYPQSIMLSVKDGKYDERILLSTSKVLPVFLCCFFCVCNPHINDVTSLLFLFYLINGERGSGRGINLRIIEQVLKLKWVSNPGVLFCKASVLSRTPRCCLQNEVKHKSCLKALKF